MEKRILRTWDSIAITQDELDQYTTIHLLNEFNTNTEAIGGKTISKFSDRKSALRRTWGSMLATVATEMAIPEPAPSTPVQPTVTCYLCGKERPKNKTFDMMRDGAIAYFCKDTDCKPASTKDKLVKATAQVKAEATAKAEKRSAKVAKVKGKNPNIGKFDDCALVVLENKRSSATSIRSSVYNYIADHKSCTIPEIVGAGIATLPVVRDCVKKLFADLKISISGWKVATPRTFNFERI